MITPSAPPLGHDDLGRDRVRLVLDHDDRVLGQPAHAAEQELRGCRVISCGRPGEVGVEALDAAVVEREHVVLRRLDQEQALQLGQLLRVLRGEVVRLRPVVGAVELPDVVVERRRSRPCTHGVLWRVTAVQPLW